MKLADVVRILDKVDYNFIADGSRAFLNFAIGYISSAEEAGCDVTYDQLLESYDNQTSCEDDDYVDASGGARSVVF